MYSLEDYDYHLPEENIAQQPAAQRDQSRLLVVGPYTVADRLPFDRELRRLGLSDVHFIGYVPDEELARFYQCSQILCAPSTGINPEPHSMPVEQLLPMVRFAQVQRARMAAIGDDCPTNSRWLAHFQSLTCPRWPKDASPSLSMGEPSPK